MPDKKSIVSLNNKSIIFA